MRKANPPGTNVTALTAVLSLGLALGTSAWAFHTISSFLFAAEPARLTGTISQPIASDNTAYPLFRNIRRAGRDAAGLIMLSYADATQLSAQPDPKPHPACVTQ